MYILYSENIFNFDHAKILSDGKKLTLSQASPFFKCRQYKTWKYYGKKWNCLWRAILLFPVFFTLSENFLSFSSILKFSSANSLNLKQSKIIRHNSGDGSRKIS